MGIFEKVIAIGAVVLVFGTCRNFAKAMKVILGLVLSYGVASFAVDLNAEASFIWWTVMGSGTSQAFLTRTSILSEKFCWEHILASVFGVLLGVCVSLLLSANFTFGFNAIYIAIIPSALALLAAIFYNCKWKLSYWQVPLASLILLLASIGYNQFVTQHPLFIKYIVLQLATVSFFIAAIKKPS